MRHVLVRVAAMLGLVAAPAIAHEIRPLVVEIEQRTSRSASVRVVAPDSLPAGNLPVVILPGDCSPARVEAGSSRPVTCARSLAGRDVTIHYPLFNPAVSTMLRYGKGTGSDTGAGELYAPDDLVLTVPAADAAPSLASFFLAGIDHILGGIDHLLFLVCLLALCSSARMVLLTVTGFTIGHSITLLLSVAGLGLPPAPVEALIALSIVVMAAAFLRGEVGWLLGRRPVLVAAGIGLLHGFGFAGFLSSIGVPDDAALPAVLIFNLGVEAGQIAFITALFALWRLASVTAARLRADRAWVLRARTATVFASGALGAFWFVERAVAIV
ncbi:hypothetical protein EKN06_06085 [Croceicoccus ponticola]|uniref:HupE/UreJ family protein n=1 Tax=Croceicoccus ponticola TaxID=2217664 RepID=A0A437GXZ7_9SPHN|nr:HupE/UreJ family protein [Croceicoccus ponticola]RVQ67528.1 hypothetical protein EKN06_06085 [Croceicoccus ponticola]